MELSVDVLQKRRRARMPLPTRCHIRTKNSPIHGEPRETTPCGLRDHIPPI